YGCTLRSDDGVVARESGGHFGDDAEAHRVMIAAGDQRRPRGRAERGGVELRITQSRLRDAVHGRRRDDTAKGAGHAVTLVIRHDEQDVGRALARYYSRWPIRFGLLGVHVDGTAERRRLWRKIFSVNRRRGAG